MNKQGKEVKKELYEDAVGTATYAILAEFIRIPVTDFEKFRNDMAGLGAGVVVMKNTLARIVFERHGLEEISEYLVGPSVLVYGHEEIAPVAKSLDKFTRTFREVKVKAIIYEGSIFSGNQFKSFTTLPTKDEVRSKLLSVLQAPAGRMLRVLNPAQRLVTVLSQYADKQG
jgi:large subunit ribosomal protein L10